MKLTASHAGMKIKIGITYDKKLNTEKWIKQPLQHMYNLGTFKKLNKITIEHLV